MNKWSQLNTKIESCTKCKRLVQYCKKVAKEKRKAYQNDDYWGKAVENFGDKKAELLIIGLAPGAHGANRTGRLFTGDKSGEWLYRALYKAGFASHKVSENRSDILRLKNCAITNVIHCAPPQNKTNAQEIANCKEYLNELIEILPIKVFLVLGQLAWTSLFSELKRQQKYTNKTPKFAHNIEIPLDNGQIIVSSYHPSQQNTFTKRLTEPMFDSVFKRINKHLL